MDREQKMRQLADLLAELYPAAYIDIQKSCYANEEPQMDFVSIRYNVIDEYDNCVDVDTIYFPAAASYNPYYVRDY